MVPYDRAFYLIVDDDRPDCRGGGGARPGAPSGWTAWPATSASEVVDRWNERHAYETEMIGEIDPAELERRMGTPEVAVLDVRNSSEWEAGHIPGSLNLPLSRLTERLEEVPRDRELVVYCRSGARAEVAIGLLQAKGVRNILHLTGDFQRWEESGRAVERGAEIPLRRLSNGDGGPRPPSPSPFPGGPMCPTLSHAPAPQGEPSSAGATTEVLLARILERVDALAGKVERLESLLGPAPAALAMLTDAVDEEVRRAAVAGVDVDERLRGLLRLAEVVSAPATLRAVDALAQRADRVEALLALADEAPGVVAMVVDSADEAVREAGARGLDLDAAVRRGAGAALRFGGMMGPAELDALEALLRSGVLDPASVRTVAALGRALAAGAEERGPEPGLRGLWRASRDPELRRALAFALRVGRAFGRELPPAPPV